MNFTIDRSKDVAIVRLDESRLMYPLLADFAGAVTGLLDGGDRKVLLDFTKVTYVDSATIGCLMDLYRQATAKGGALKLAGGAEARRDDAHDDRRAQLPGPPRRRGRGARELRSLTAMRTITTSKGVTIELDGDMPVGARSAVQDLLGQPRRLLLRAHGPARCSTCSAS